MSNETGLDWLARNVHKWLEGKREVLVCWPRNVDTLIWSYVLSDTGWITKDQWLSRRAELQNKPSWSEFRKSATYMAQDSDGAWRAFECEPTPSSHIWNARHGWRGYANIDDLKSPKGEVLGDWRETLERRPADMSEQAVTARLKEATDNVLSAAPELMADKYKFDPFISVEDAETTKHATITPSKYTKTIRGVSVDVYDVLQAWGVSNPALQHLIKKALQCGQRGHKDSAQDLQDIIDSAIRAKELG